jgi:hypothetical protein
MKSAGVWGEQVEIDVVQKSKTVWIESGRHKGRYFEIEGAKCQAVRRNLGRCGTLP